MLKKSLRSFESTDKNAQPVWTRCCLTTSLKIFTNASIDVINRHIYGKIHSLVCSDVEFAAGCT